MKKNLSKQILYTCIVLTLITSLVFGFNVFGIEKAPTKSYVTIQIESGHTLWSLAKDYMNEDYYSIQEYISEVKLINNLKSDLIIADHTLIIPIVK